MKIPTGEPVERSIEIPKINPRHTIESLMDDGFTGYSTLTIHGETGLEEGIIVYKNGKIIGSEYAYFKYSKRFKSEKALERTLNAFNSRNGIMDTYKLTSHQIQLFKTMNEESILQEPIDKEKLELSSSFTTKYEEELMKKKTKKLTREQLMKKYGLTGLETNEDTGGQLVQKARQEHRTLKKFLEKEKREK